MLPKKKLAIVRWTFTWTGMSIVVLISLFTLNYHFEFFAFAGHLFLFYAAKLLMILTGLFASAKVARKSILTRTISGVRISALMFLIIFLLLEAVFSFIPRSHHAEISYASIIWEKRFYHLNDQGFRDTLIAQKNKNKPALVFLGDSFTAGYGLNKESQRFSNLAAKAFGSKYEYYNLGVKATGIKEQFPNLSLIENPEKVLVYQIYINDLDEFCLEHIPPPEFDIYMNFGAYDQYFAKISFLCNYIYFSLPNQQLIETYYGYFKNCYQNEAIQQAYFNALLSALKNASESLGFQKIIVVHIPTLAAPEFSSAFEVALEKQLITLPNATFVSIQKEISGLPLRKKIVNKQDTHASRQVNQIIALKIAQEL
jgi:hypothetical protein